MIKTKKITAYGIVEEKGNGKKKESITYIPIAKEQLKIILTCLFDSRYLFETKPLRLAIASMLYPNQKEEIEKLIKNYE